MRFLADICNTLHSYGAQKNNFDIFGAQHFYGAAPRIVINLLFSYSMHRHLFTDTFPLHFSILWNVFRFP
jgi:hypothetical protein